MCGLRSNRNLRGKSAAADLKESAGTTPFRNSIQEIEPQVVSTMMNR